MVRLAHWFLVLNSFYDIFPPHSYFRKSNILILKFHDSGYYRVNYYPQNWDLLTEQLQKDPKKIHVLNRAQMIDDSLTLAIDDYIPYSIPLKLMKYLDKEPDILPWLTALSKFEYLYSLYESSPTGHYLKVSSHKLVLNIKIKKKKINLVIISGLYDSTCRKSLP